MSLVLTLARTEAGVVQYLVADRRLLALLPFTLTFERRPRRGSFLATNDSLAIQREHSVLE